ncbi:ABC transporter, permease protein [Streptococcus agalactiae COH1]|nr:ABC transporter, permease protein [Streptococcus agalactiae COH1]
MPLTLSHHDSHVGKVIFHSPLSLFSGVAVAIKIAKLL